MLSTHKNILFSAIIFLTYISSFAVAKCEAQGKPQVVLAEGKARPAHTPTRECEPCSDEGGRCNNQCYISYCDSKTDYEWRFANSAPPTNIVCDGCFDLVCTPEEGWGCLEKTRKLCGPCQEAFCNSDNIFDCRDVGVASCNREECQIRECDGTEYKCHDNGVPVDGCLASECKERVCDDLTFTFTCKERAKPQHNNCEEVECNPVKADYDINPKTAPSSLVYNNCQKPKCDPNVVVVNDEHRWTVEDTSEKPENCGNCGKVDCIQSGDTYSYQCVKDESVECVGEHCEDSCYTKECTGDASSGYNWTFAASAEPDDLNCNNCQEAKCDPENGWSCEQGGVPDNLNCNKCQSAKCNPDAANEEERWSCEDGTAPENLNCDSCSEPSCNTETGVWGCTQKPAPEGFKCNRCFKPQCKGNSWSCVFGGADSGCKLCNGGTCVVDANATGPTDCQSGVLGNFKDSTNNIDIRIATVSCTRSNNSSYCDKGSVYFYDSNTGKVYQHDGEDRISLSDMGYKMLCANDDVCQEYGGDTIAIYTCNDEGKEGRRFIAKNAGWTDSTCSYTGAKAEFYINDSCCALGVLRSYGYGTFYAGQAHEADIMRDIFEKCMPSYGSFCPQPQVIEETTTNEVACTSLYNGCVSQYHPNLYGCAACPPGQRYTLGSKKFDAVNYRWPEITCEDGTPAKHKYVYVKDDATECKEGYTESEYAGVAYCSMVTD